MFIIGVTISIMSSCSKDQNVCDIVCKSHSARSERELYRICPSKLSKRELEDLYFVLLENNLELKRSVNEQREQIKVLSTKVHRMTAAQRSCFNKEQKDCCVHSNAVVSEQKESIADLRRANERLSERLRALNMRLCSAKQFARSATAPRPATATATTARRLTAAATSPKNSLTSALNAKESELNVTTISVSCQYLDKDAPSTVTAETETDVQEICRGESEKCCDENKCRTVMEELKQKIVGLQEELASTRRECAARLQRLERRAAGAGGAGGAGGAEQLAARAAAAHARADELATQLSIEKRKVSELEMQVKAAQLSATVADTIGQHFANLMELNRKELEEKCLQSVVSPRSPEECDKSSPMRMEEVNEGVLKRIVELQTQLDRIKISAMEGDNLINDKMLSSERLENGDDTTLYSMDEGTGYGATRSKWDPEAVAGTSRDTSNDDGCPYTPRDYNQKYPSPFTEKSQEKINIVNEDRHNRFQIPGPIPTSFSNKDTKKNNVKLLSLETPKKNKIVAETVEIPVKDKLEWDKGYATDDKNSYRSTENKKELEMYSVKKLKEYLNGKNNVNDKDTIEDKVGDEKVAIISDEENINREAAQTEQNSRDNSNDAGRIESTDIDTCACGNEVEKSKESAYKIVRKYSPKSEDKEILEYVNVTGLYNELISDRKMLPQTKDAVKVKTTISHENTLINNNSSQTKHDIEPLEITRTENVFKTNLINNVAQKNENNTMDTFEIGSQKKKEFDGTTKALTFGEGSILKTFEEKLEVVVPSVEISALSKNSEEYNHGQMLYDHKVHDTEEDHNMDCVKSVHPWNGRTRVDADSFGGEVDVDTIPNKGNKGNEELNTEAVQWRAPLARSGTFTVDAPLDVKRSPRDADSDTDGEISRLTDLPTERDERSPRGSLSPGEEESSSLSRSHTWWSRSSRSSRRPLSAGELPADASARQLSSGEQPKYVDSEQVGGGARGLPGGEGSYSPPPSLYCNMSLNLCQAQARGQKIPKPTPIH